jgi:hypothetical protein
MNNDLRYYEELYAKIYCNVPDTAQLRFHGRGRSHVYGHELGEALSRNTCCSVLDLEVSMGSFAIAPVGLPPHQDHIAELLLYIRSGPALRCVRLKGRWLEYLGYLIDAVADSPHVVNFTIDEFGEYPPQSMCRLLTTNKTLKRLTIPVLGSAHSVSNAMKLNETIEDLTLVFQDDLSDAEAMGMICSLQDHQSLRKLSLRLIMAFAPTAVVVIGGLSSVLPSLLHLSDLSLEHNFHLAEMELLLEGFADNPSLVKLSLSGDVEHSAAAAFAHYMQTRNGVGTKGIITVLHFCPARWLGSESCDKGRFMADLLKTPRGSGLTSFQLDGVFQVAEIWDSVANNKTLATLTVVGGTNETKCIQVLPELLRLRELTFEGNDPFRRAGRCEAFCHALKANASLHEVLIQRVPFKNPFNDWDDNFVRQIKAWGARNRLLPLLLAKDPNDHGDGNAPETWALPLVPTLLHVAQQTPRMAPNHLLQCLLALEDSVGPRVQKARKAEHGEDCSFGAVLSFGALLLFGAMLLSTVGSFMNE